MKLASDTIAGPATAPGPAALSVVRISGERALEVADRMVRAPGPAPSQRRGGEFFHARLVNGPGEKVDDGIVLIFRAPRSYTGEDVVELQGHGGAVAADRLLRAGIEAGARLSEPGEFTRRAFLNGKLDLVQAEAVMDMIRARGDQAARAARNQLDGALSRFVTSIYDELTSLCAVVEAALDFEDFEEHPIDFGACAARLDRVRTRLKRLLAWRHTGHVLRDGALVVISGPPNVGKSTLLNRLLGTDRAIVSDLPGTTRDSIEEGCRIAGWPLRLVDTAGLRDSDCRIEREGIRRTRERMAAADLHLHVLDATQPLEPQRDEILETLSPHKTLLVVNKGDLPRRLPSPLPLPFRRVEVALAPPPPATPRGLEALTEALLDMLALDANAPAHGRVNTRHEMAFARASQRLDTVADRFAQPPDPDPVLAAQALRAAAEDLAEVLGRVYSDDLLDRIFETFCIGK